MFQKEERNYVARLFYLLNQIGRINFQDTFQAALSFVTQPSTVAISSFMSLMPNSTHNSATGNDDDLHDAGFLMLLLHCSLDF